VLLVCACIASVLLLPQDLAAFGQSLLATSLFASNFDFWQQAGYFGPTADLIPLLHTWSLAVEEQFYIFFPLFLLVCATGSRQRLLVATLAVVAASLALSIVGVNAYPDAAFYLAHTRAWELGIGALLAMGALAPSHSALVRNIAAALGLGAIAWSVFTYSSATAFPGAAALLPCAGAAAIIWAGTGGYSVVGDALGSRPFVLVGLVSYSLYLWHWPLLAFARYYAIRPLTDAEAAGVLALSFVAAIVSWHFVERPFRGKSGRFDRRRIFIAAGTVMATAALYGGVLLASSGWPSRMSPDVREIMASAEDRRTRDWSCGDRTARQISAGTMCRIGKQGGTAPSFMVWGDSHARVIAEALGNVAARHGRSGLMAVRSACAPLLGVTRSDRGNPRVCVDFNQAVLGAIAARPEVTDVVLAGRWALAAEGTRYKQEPGEVVYLADGNSTVESHEENRRVYARSLRRTVESLLALGRRVWVVAPIPEVGWDVPSVLARSHRFGHDIAIAPSRTEFEQRQAFVMQALQQIARLPGVTVVYPDAALCAGPTCTVAVAGRPIYFDSDHLTLQGAASVGPIFETIFAPRPGTT
jgi:peptidoglycan/LPS O-acetylase OafA/YrhL